jgi:hypothetical protein
MVRERYILEYSRGKDRKAGVHALEVSLGRKMTLHSALRRYGSCGVHDPRAAAAQAANPAPQIPQFRKLKRKQRPRSANATTDSSERSTSRNRSAGPGKQTEDERREKEWEAERARREKLQP